MVAPVTSAMLFAAWDMARDICELFAALTCACEVEPLGTTPREVPILAAAALAAAFSNATFGSSGAAGAAGVGAGAEGAGTGAAATAPVAPNADAPAAGDAAATNKENELDFHEFCRFLANAATLLSAGESSERSVSSGVLRDPEAGEQEAPPRRVGCCGTSSATRGTRVD